MTELCCEGCGDTDSLVKCDGCYSIFCISCIKKDKQHDTHYCNDCFEEFKS